MAMSTDRVKFTIPMYYESTPSKKKKMQRILQSAFDISFRESNDMFNSGCGDPVIICRPSQFARFLIYRHAIGLQNQFKELEAELYEEKTDGHVIDVHKRPRQGCYPVDFSSDD